MIAASPTSPRIASVIATEVLDLVARRAVGRARVDVDVDPALVDDPPRLGGVLVRRVRDRRALVAVGERAGDRAGDDDGVLEGQGFAPAESGKCHSLLCRFRAASASGGAPQASSRPASRAPATVSRSVSSASWCGSPAERPAGPPRWTSRTGVRSVAIHSARAEVNGSRWSTSAVACDRRAAAAAHARQPSSARDVGHRQLARAGEVVDARLARADRRRRVSAVADVIGMHDLEPERRSRASPRSAPGIAASSRAHEARAASPKTCTCGRLATSAGESGPPTMHGPEHVGLDVGPGQRVPHRALELGLLRGVVEARRSRAARRARSAAAGGRHGSRRRRRCSV